MTQVFDKKGNRLAVTKVQANPCFVVQKKTKTNDGYRAIKIAYGKPKKKLSQPLEGIHKASKTSYVPYFKEFRGEFPEVKIGDALTIESFSEGDAVNVTGTTKGRGYQGVVKRYNFAGHPATHGHKDQLRTTGAIGSGHPQRVRKGKRLPGHMGRETLTAKNLKIIKIDAKQNCLFISGAIPGSRNSWISIESAQ